MALHQWLGLGAAVLLVSFVVFAFRQGMKVKPDRDRKVEDWQRTTQGGPGG